MNRKNFAVLGLGSNLGRKSANLCCALQLISGFCDLKKVSDIYRTASMLRDDQGAYFNLCALAETDMEPEELLVCLKHIEKQMGRTVTGHWYSRVIDIDIIDFNNKPYSSGSLNIPHPGMGERSFVLFPLRDILPGYVHPLSCLSIENMLDLIKDDFGILKVGAPLWRL